VPSARADESGLCGVVAKAPKPVSQFGKVVEDMRLVLMLFFAATLQAADYDFIILNARIVDGTGNPWYFADVGLKEGKIATIGSLKEAKADRIVDAAGRVLAPGFVDVHTHVETNQSRAGVEKIPRGDNYLLDGVTSVVTGNCGSSQVHVGDWFRKLEKLGLGLNVATLVGHNSVRREVMGSEDRKASADDISSMQALIEEAMKEGAVGFSTGLLYVPGTYADTAEVIQLAKASAKHGGIYASHIRDQGEKLLESITEAVTVGREAGMPVQISHFKVNSKKRWGNSVHSIALVEKYRSEGVDVAVDQYPYDRASTSLSICFPAWSLSGGPEKVKERLLDPATRNRIIQGMKDLLAYNGFSDYSYATVASFEPEPSLEGKTISEINILKGRSATLDDEIETILELTALGGASMIYHSMSMEDVERIIRYPNTAVASDGGIQELGDGKPHPRSYGTNARVLADFVRNRGFLTLEDAIRRMTSLPALRFGFDDRGLIREGLAADLVLFDPDRVQDKATFADPHQYSEGFDYVLVNGVTVVDNGRLTEARPGQILRHKTN
jgi:N-acyl-D-amino-acid deacylase